MYAVDMLFEHCFNMCFEVALRAAIHIHHSLANHTNWKRYGGEKWGHSYIYILSHLFTVINVFSLLFLISCLVIVKDTSKDMSLVETNNKSYASCKKWVYHMKYSNHFFQIEI